MLKKITAIATLIVFAFSLCAFASDESVVTEYNGQNYVTKNQIWNLDFEDADLYYASKTSPNIADSSKKTLYNAAGDYIGANIGSTASTISIEENTDATNMENGRSVCMTSGNSSDNVQFNNLLTTTSNNTVVVYEMDICTSDFNAAKGFHPQFYTNGGSTKVWANKVTLNKAGYFEYGGNVKQAKTNTWYHLMLVMDIPSGKEVCYIDGEYLGEASFNTTGFHSMFKLSISFSGGLSKFWLDNFNIYELTPLVETDNATAGEDYVEVTFSDSIPADYFVKDGEVTNITASFEKTPVEFISCTASEEVDNTLIFKSSTSFPSAVDVNFDISYYGASVKGTTSTEPADVDVKNVSVVRDGTSFAASAECVNKTEDESSIIMILVLFDDEGKVVKVSSTAQTANTDGQTLSTELSCDKATNAYVYFMTDWTSLRAFKDVVYYSK